MAKLKKTLRTCKNGHQYFKSSDCPTCPICEQNKKPESGFLSLLSAPARRALELHGIKSLEQLTHYKEADLLSFHGFGPSSIPKLKNALAQKGLQLKSGK